MYSLLNNNNNNNIHKKTSIELVLCMTFIAVIFMFVCMCDFISDCRKNIIIPTTHCTSHVIRIIMDIQLVIFNLLLQYQLFVLNKHCLVYVRRGNWSKIFLITFIRLLQITPEMYLKVMILICRQG